MAQLAEEGKLSLDDIKELENLVSADETRVSAKD